MSPWTRRLPQLALTHMAGTANIISVSAMAPVISRDLGLSAAQFGLFITSYYGAQALFSVPSGGVTDRLGVGRTIVLAHGVMVAAALGLAVAPSFSACLVALFVMGIGYSMTNPSTARGVADWFPQAKRGLAMGLKQVGVPLGGLVGAGAGWLAAGTDWQTVMVGVAALIGISGVICLSLIPPSRSDGAGRLSAVQNIRAVVKDRNLTTYFAGSGLTNVGQTNFFAFLTLFLTEAARMGQGTASLFLGLAQAVSALARVGLGAISDRAFGGNRRTLMVWVTALAALFTAAMVWVDPVWGVYTGLVLTVMLGITIAAVAPVMQAITVELADPRLAGSATGYSMLWIHGFSMTAPLVFGFAVDHWGGFSAGWLVTAAIMVVGVGMVAFGVTYPRRTGQGQTDG